MGILCTVLAVLLLVFSSICHRCCAEGYRACVTNSGTIGVVIPRDYCNTETDTSDQTQQTVCCPTFVNEADCGRKSKYGTVGFMPFNQETELDEFPWTVKILYRTWWGLQSLCTGTLINRRFVLTAAHCFEAYGRHPYAVRLGEWDLTTFQDCKYTRHSQVCNPDSTLDIAIEKYTQHPSFSRHNHDQVHDIALVQLAHDVTYTGQIGPACLANFSKVVQPPIVGLNFTATGWGRKRQRKIKILMQGRDIDECRKVYRPFHPEVSGGQLCVGGDQDLCKGDSGSPIMLWIDNRWVQFGIMSFGSNDCRTPIPGVFTNVARYSDWIQSLVTSWYSTKTAAG